MEKAGFQDVQVHQRAVPWGPWPKDSKLRKLGATMAACCETGIEAYGLGVMTKFGGYKVDEAKAMIAAAMKDIMGCKVRTYNLQYQVVGRKPMVA